MKIAIMQPYFLPYLGYFSLIKHTDRFILFDPVQFIRHGWVERNRILKPGTGWQYIAVPLIKHRRDTKISEIQIKNSLDWKDTIFRQMEHYKKRSPFYADTIGVLKRAFDIETDNIVKLNGRVLRTICDYINIEINLDIFSEMNLSIEKVNAPDEWALNICKALGDIDEYWNPEGGLEFFDRNKYESAGIDIKFLKMNLPRYPQRRPEFEAGLSIVDVMMFNEPSKITEMLDDYKLLKSGLTMKEMAVTADKHDEFRSNKYCIIPLETYDKIRKVIYDFDEVFNPPISDRIADLDAYADKLHRNALVYAACDEAILGFVAFYANDAISHTAYLTQIAVKPEAQGRKIGVKLLNVCIEIAKRNTMTELKLEVSNHNDAAISLYEKNGFEFCGVASVNSIYMKRKI